MGQPSSTWTPKDDRHVEIAVSLTRTCIARGTTLLPFRHADALPEGTLTLIDRENGTELKVEHLPPRELAGFDDYFQHIGLKPNDTLVLRIAADGSGDMEIKRQPRRPQAPPPLSKTAREAEPEEERPPFLEWRPEPIAYQAPIPRPRREVPEPPAAPKPAITEAFGQPAPELDPPLEEELPEWEPPRASRPTESVRERLANGRSWLLRALRRDAPAAPQEPPVEPFRFQPRTEYAAPQPTPSQPRFAPTPLPASQSSPTLIDWEEDVEWDAFAPEPTRAPTGESAATSAQKPTDRAPTPAEAPEPQPFTLESLPDVEPSDPQVSVASPTPQPADVPERKAVTGPRPLPLLEGEEFTLTKPPAVEERTPDPEPELGPTTQEDSTPARSGAEDGEPLRKVREYLARPETPAIVRVQNVSTALGLDAEVAASLLEHVAGEAETRLNRIRDDAYLLKRAG